MRLFIFVAFAIFSFSFFNFAFALEVPKSIHAFLSKKGRTDLVSRFQEIPLVSPEEFSQNFLTYGPIQPIGAGFNGIAFKDSQNRVGKFIFTIYASQGLVELDPNVSKINQVDEQKLSEVGKNWKTLFDDTAIRTVDIPLLRGGTARLGSQPIGEELLGTLLWAAYNPRSTSFPDLVSNDGLALRMPFLEGIPLLHILQSEREGSLLHQKYNMQKLWKEVVFWQRINEIMLLDAGVTVDMCTPGNLIVQGDPSNPRITLIDQALLRPSEEAKEYLEQQGWKIPEPAFADALRLIVWPNVSEHIVASKLWNLNFQQSLDYLKAYYDLKTDQQAAFRLSKVKEWKIVEAPFLGDYSNIRKARLWVAVQNLKSCSHLLTDR